MNNTTPIITPRQIGKAIFDRRKDLGWTQQQLADKAGVSRGFINRIEQGASSAVYPQKLLDTLAVLGLELSIEVAQPTPSEITQNAAHTTKRSPFVKKEHETNSQAQDMKKSYALDPALLKKRGR